MARQTKGRLYKSGKKGAFHLQYYVNGKEFKITLKDENGNIITTDKQSRIAAEKILHPIKAANKAEQLRQILDAVETAEQKAERLIREQKNSQQQKDDRERDERASISNGWRLFMECPKRPVSCKRFSFDCIPRNTTAGNYKGYYDRFTDWMTINYPNVRLLSDVDPETVSAFMDAIRSSSASGTYNKYLQFFNCFFDTLSSAGKIAVDNPFRDIDRAEPQYNSKRPLTVEQIKTLLDTALGDMKTLIALGYFTGLRQGDCCTLQWREVDLLRCVIERIPRKTEHTIRDKAQAVVKIGIPPYLLSLLSEIPLKKRRGYVLPKFAEMYLDNKETYINKALMLHFERCGIQTRREGTGATYVYDGKKKINVGNARAIVETGFHSLRYSYISHNAEAGTPAAIIQRNAGHANPAMTEHYTRISDKAAVKYAAALQLPEKSTDGDIVDTIAETSKIESERVRLRDLADTLPIEKIRAFLLTLN